MFFKTIIQGRLEFGNIKSYEKVTKMFLQRVETYYKTDVLFKYEDLFLDDELSLEIPRFVGQVSERTFKTTTGLIEYCAQFAIAGSVRAWFIIDTGLKHFVTIEPKGDKGAIMSFEKGRKLVKLKGREAEAIEALSLAIEKYDRHAQAYERRAKVNFLMKNYHDALRDYNKCIGIDPTIPTSYYGIAKIHIMREEWDDAIENLDESIKKSIALQTLYWKSRRLKAQCHIHKREWDKAAFDLKLFANRTFEDSNPNKVWLRWANYQYGLVLLELEQYLDALKAFEKASLFPTENDGVDETELLTNKGIAKQKAGKSGYVKDIKAAAAKGSTKAKNLLKGMKK
jgi:tetratricopeptide (TPR) repeat protein